MKKPELLTWLRKHRKHLNITAIGRDAGIPNLRLVVNENKDGYGNTFTLADKHVENLHGIVADIKKES